MSWGWRSTLTNPSHAKRRTSAPRKLREALHEGLPLQSGADSDPSRTYARDGFGFGGVELSTSTGNLEHCPRLLTASSHTHAHPRARAPTLPPARMQTQASNRRLSSSETTLITLHRTRLARISQKPRPLLPWPSQRHRRGGEGKEGVYFC